MALFMVGLRIWGPLDLGLVCLAQETGKAVTVPGQITSETLRRTTKGGSEFDYWYSYQGPDGKHHLVFSPQHRHLDKTILVSTLRGEPDASLIASDWGGQTLMLLVIPNPLLLMLILCWQWVKRARFELELLELGSPAEAHLAGEVESQKGSSKILTYEVGSPPDKLTVTTDVSSKRRGAYRQTMPALLVKGKPQAKLLCDMLDRPTLKNDWWTFTHFVNWQTLLGLALLGWGYLVWWAIRAIG